MVSRSQAMKSLKNAQENEKNKKKMKNDIFCEMKKYFENVKIPEDIQKEWEKWMQKIESEDGILWIHKKTPIERLEIQRNARCIEQSDKTKGSSQETNKDNADQLKDVSKINGLNEQKEDGQTQENALLFEASSIKFVSTEDLKTFSLSKNAVELFDSERLKNHDFLKVKVKRVVLFQYDLKEQKEKTEEEMEKALKARCAQKVAEIRSDRAALTEQEKKMENKKTSEVRRNPENV